MKHLALRYAVLILLPISALACGDDDPEDANTATAALSPSPMDESPSPNPTRNGGGEQPDDPAYPPDARTGVAEVDSVIDAVLAGDEAALKDLIVPLQLACAGTPSGGMPQPPQCPPATPDGTPIDAFPVGGPGGSYVLASEAVERSFAALLGSGPRLFAAHRVAEPDNDPAWPDGDYRIVFVGLGQVRGVMLHVTDEGIVNITYGGGRTNPYDFTGGVEPDDFLLPPLR